MKTQDDSSIEKRLLLAILLSMAILFVTPYIFNPFFPQPAEVEEGAAAAVEQPGGAAAAAVSPAGVPKPAESGATATEELAGAAAGEPATQGEERRILVESDSMLLEFNTVGATLVQARLKGLGVGGAEDEVMLPAELPANGRRPLAFEHEDAEISDQLTNGAWEVDGVSGDKVRAPATLRFHYRSGDIVATKTVTIAASGYELEVAGDLSLNGRATRYQVSLGTGIGPGGNEKAGDFGNPSIAHYVGGKVTRYKESDLKDGDVRLEVAPRWAGIDSQYFALVAVEPTGVQSLRMQRREWIHTDASGDEITVPLVSGSLGMSGEGTFRYFIGPKSADELMRSDATLGDLIDYGWFGILVRPLLVGLKWVYGFIGNYGWSIIVLTLLINLALFPIRYKQMASMKKMSALQPKLKSIQDRYKRMKRDDPRRQQMNAEIMGLYKEHGVNPLGGCFPLLLQMPILFAFYRMLAASIELRGAPFVFWIHDLSKADPYYVTPIVMGLTMVAQQKMTPATGDPSQRRMMMLLPVVFTFFFLNVSSGLAVYFLFSNVFAMLLQLGVQKLRPELGQAGKSSGKQSKKKS